MSNFSTKKAIIKTGDINSILSKKFIKGVKIALANVA